MVQRELLLHAIAYILVRLDLAGIGPVRRRSLDRMIFKGS